MIYVAIVLCTSTPFLLLAGTRISARIRASQTPAPADRLAWIDDRIRTRPDQRAAWRSLRRVMQEEDEL